EPTFEEYINKLCDIFDEVKRVLRKDGTCFVNLGDSYYSVSGGKFLNDKLGSKEKNLDSYLSKANEIKKNPQWLRPSRDAYREAGIKGKCLICGKDTLSEFCSRECLNKKGNDFRSQNRLLPSKSLCNIPSRFSIEMQNRGWILRNVIIWYKPNCMPSSVKDRFTVDFEYLFFFVKSKNYFFETQYEPITESTINRVKYNFNDLKGDGIVSMQSSEQRSYADKIEEHIQQGRNKRTVWKITTKSFREAHFATYPEELCETPIKAGCPEGGIVLDPFFGAGTTGLVALKQNKNFVGIELNPEYIKIAKKRIEPWLQQTKLF
ncbi:MAG: site-specific DNA-methyltransferase, partial [Nanoarchaeota archaeon]